MYWTLVYTGLHVIKKVIAEKFSDYHSQKFGKEKWFAEKIESSSRKTNEEHKESMRSVVSKAYEQIAKTSKMSLFKSHRKEYGDGEQKRDFLWMT